MNRKEKTITKEKRKGSRDNLVLEHWICDAVSKGYRRRKRKRTVLPGEKKYDALIYFAKRSHDYY